MSNHRSNVINDNEIIMEENTRYNINNTNTTINIIPIQQQQQYNLLENKSPEHSTLFDEYYELFIECCYNKCII